MQTNEQLEHMLEVANKKAEIFSDMLLLEIQNTAAANSALVAAQELVERLKAIKHV